MVSCCGQPLFKRPATSSVRESHSPLEITPHKARVIGDDLMSARIALLHILRMAAERGGPAVADCFECLSLMGPDYVVPFRKELLFARAEDIGHFEPMLPHGFFGTEERTRLIESRVSSGLFVERTALSERCR
jgi:hypothetical protein